MRSFLAAEHAAVAEAITGLSTTSVRLDFAARWLRRLMFAYCLQRNGFLGDADYLGRHFRAWRERCSFWHGFLRPLFHDGLSQTKRTPCLQRLLGPVPYLGAGLFTATADETDADMSDAAIQRIVACFDAQEWRMDGSSEALGLMLEDPTQRKSLGAYYTGADVAAYIARNTIVPWFLDALVHACPRPFRRDGPAWRLLRTDPDRYIPDAVRHGVDERLPAAIARGLDDVAGRGRWNMPARPPFTLPTETWREHVSRRRRYGELRDRLRAGEITTVPALVAANLDGMRFALDVLNLDAVRKVASPILQRVTVLDPTCGAGAFLLAAADVLESLARACRSDGRSFLRNNLYGVDLRGAAIETCRMRLVLRMLACAAPGENIEPFTTGTWNIRAGDALSGRPFSHDEGPSLARRASEGRNLFHWPAEFPAIARNGGFAVVLGNPPFVERRTLPREAPLPPGYRTADARNLYALCIERAAHLLAPGGWFGMVVPAGVLGLDAAAGLRDVLLRKYTDSFCSTYATRPSRLFPTADQRQCIYVGRAGAGSTATIHTTKYHHWYAEERPTLLDRLEYHRSECHPRLARIPQLGSALAASVLAKLEAHGARPLRSYYANRNCGHLLSYHRSPRYWVRAVDFAPHFRSPRGTRSIYHYRDVWFDSPVVARIAGACLNSSLFFFWFVTLGNGRNITGVEVGAFPLGELTPALLTGLPRLFDRLMHDYRKHAVLRRRHDCEFQEFRPARSKPLIDAIDRVLARHYGFTAEELDFVLHYEAKYRKGKEEQADG